MDGKQSGSRDRQGDRIAAAPSRSLVAALVFLSALLTACPGDSDRERPAEVRNEDGPPPVIFRFPTKDRVVALTIDDGPDPETTPRILDVLQMHGVKATFFLHGKQVEENEAIVARTRDEGHELGNHAVGNYSSIVLSQRALAGELRYTHDLLSPYGEIRWFRPGNAAYRRAMLETAASFGYRTALGDVCPFDFIVPSSKFQVRYILKNVRPGSIIVLHDRGGRGRRTAVTLDTVLPQLRAEGYEVGTLSAVSGRVSGDGTGTE